MASGGAVPFSLRDLNATPQRAGRARAQVLYGVTIVNNQAAIAFIQMFNVAAVGAIVLGTTTPDFEFACPASVTAAAIVPAIGVYFAKGCFVASTTLERGSVASAANVQFFGQFV